MRPMSGMYPMSGAGLTVPFLGRQLRSMGLLPRDNGGWMKLGLGLAAVVCGGFLLARYARHLHQ